ncbi:MAG: malate dehydrogenase [Muribaculaceae bacterium]|nr:malate dehydrogenase [Muribaculaceae bacterium]MDE5712557.1 malate dehydrogenase [Muribaculaceae bacterium]MDE6096885.1 malate dehydrogenase [Muribaculaceae bacterium]
MSKVTVVGAGNVGATAANVIALREIADEVVMIDIKEGVSEGKAMDMMQTANLLDMNTRISGVTNNYEATKDSDVVVITSGIPRKPGMTREELIGVNAGIVKQVTESVLAHSPNAVIVCVSNPMDTMTYLIHKVSGLPKNRIIGMGGALDSSRFKYYLSKALNANPNEVEGFVIGGHGDTTMIPMKRFATLRGIPVTELLSAEELDKVAADTMVGGATLTKLLGTSAWYAPGAATAEVVEAVIHDQDAIIPCSALLDGEYGEKDLCIGVPCVLGKGGIKKILEIELNEEEKALFKKSAEAVHKTNAALPC